MAGGGNIPGALDPRADSIFLGAHVASDERPRSAEDLLWLSVVARAWLDAFVESDSFLRNSDKPGARDPDVIRAEARRWLTIGFGSAAQDREDVCVMADIDPDLVRSAARKKLAEVKAAEAEKRTAKVVQLDTLFAQLLDGAEDMPPADIDAALTALAGLESEAA